MSTLAYYEPHKFSAGALALVVHAIFFSLLYFSFNWHVKTPPAMEVAMWDKLPEPVPEIAPPPPPVPPQAEPAVVLKAAELIAPPKADIEMKEKKKNKAERGKKEKLAAKKSAKLEKAKLAEQEKQRAQAAQAELAKQQAQAEQQQQRDKQRAAQEHSARENELINERKAKMRAETDAATQGEVARYKDLIQAKIRRNIVMPPDVAENAEAVFLVIVLPGGLVMDNPRLLKSSGNAAYDSAAERAIYKAQPLPMPQDAALARMFRELRLSVKP